jgi:hypothetical protein
MQQIVPAIEVPQNQPVRVTLPTSTSAQNATTTKTSQATTSVSVVESNTTAAQTEGCTLLPYTGKIPLNQVPYYTSGDPDFRGGMVCHFVINPALPIFTFRFIGQADSSLGNIEITEGSSTKVLQTIDEDIYPDAIAPAVYQAILMPVDANFDGYEDLPILTGCGATGNCTFDFYLYDPMTNQFVYNSFLSGLGTFHVDSSTRQIIANSNESYADWENDTYQYENGQYILIEKQISTGQSDDMATVQVYQLQGGKMVLTSSTTSKAY